MTQRALARGAVALGLGACALAAAVAADGSIYVCTDAQGRRLTSDRPIAECSDRTQRELNRNGTLRRDLGPALTPSEKTAAEEREREAAEDRVRAQDTRRRDRALATRYPTPEAHERERQQTLARVDDTIKAANARIGQLAQQRKAADAEMEFYASKPARVPQSLKRQMADIEASTAIQQRFIAEQEAEKLRVNARFDDERARLRQLWARPAG